MDFVQVLNDYINTLDITAKELAESSGLTPSVISRYRTGERQPALDSVQLEMLIHGLCQLARQKGHSELSQEQITSSLTDALNKKNVEYEKFFEHFTLLLDALDINMKALAAGINFDITFLYRIRSGKRKPQNISAFSEALCRYITKNYHSDEHLEILHSITGCSKAELTDNSDCHKKLMNWLISGEEETVNQLEHFLHTLDEFDLNEYIEAIHFNDIKVPTAPFHLPVSKNYYGIKNMRQGELDFFKTTVLSKSTTPIFMCGDMPMEDMAEDMDFNKKWMFGIAASLKKGLHLNMVHNVDRPFHEIMLGLEAWIPIYMTGQISPYHLPDNSTNNYHHLTYVSGACALSGECINGHHNNGKYYLTNNKEELSYYQRRADDLLKKAKPLMNIYTSDNQESFQNFLKQNSFLECSHHNILSAPPLYTLTKEMLEDILESNSVSREKREKIYEYYELQVASFQNGLVTSEILDELSVISEESFQAHPVALSLAGIFLEEEILYTYEQYCSHIDATKKLARKFENYTLSVIPAAFRNIGIYIFEDNFVIISKHKAPTIHFVIHHPKMVNALEHFVVIAQE